MAHRGICIVPGCGNGGKLVRGYCRKHYGRWQRHGDPLGGRTFDGEPQDYYREVVLTYEGDECLIWPYARGSDGYGRMFTGERQEIVPRRLCEDVNGPPPTPKHEAAHSCGRGHEACCTKRHLSWKTPKENKADMIGHGTICRGERHGAAKLTDADVLAIRATSHPNQCELGRQYNVNSSLIGLILKRKIWKHI